MKIKEKEKERIEEGWIRIGGMEPLPTTRPIKPIEPPEPIRRRRRIRRRIRIRIRRRRKEIDLLKTTAAAERFITT